MAKFQQGQSGNPGGRPKGSADVRELARAQTEKSIKALVEIRDNKRAAADARVRAANSLLDRGWGKPVQDMKLSDADGGPLRIIFNGKDADL